MIWLSQMRAAKVVLGDKSIGRVVQGCLCDSLNALDGFWYDRSASGLMFVSAEHICVIGEHVIVIDNKGEKLRMKPKALAVRAVSTDGKRVGAVIDAAINEHTLAIEKIAIIRSWIDGILHGCIYVQDFTRDFAGDRVIISE